MYAAVIAPTYIPTPISLSVLIEPAFQVIVQYARKRIAEGCHFFLCKLWEISMSCFMDYRIKYGLIGAVGIYIDMRFISFHWIEADAIAILPPRSLIRLPKDELVGDALAIFKF